MPRFSIKDLLISTVLVAGGLALAKFLDYYVPASERANMLSLLCWFIAFIAINAGGLYPFRQSRALVPVGVGRWCMWIVVLLVM